MSAPTWLRLRSSIDSKKTETGAIYTTLPMSCSRKDAGVNGAMI